MVEVTVPQVDTFAVATTALKDRLAAAMAHAGLSQAELERRARLTRGFMSRPLREDRKRVDPQYLEAIARVCGVSFEWLSTGTGEMLSQARPAEPAPVALPSLPRIVRGEISPLVRAALLAYRSGPWEPEDVIAVLDVLRSGQGMVPLEDEETAVRVMSRWLRAAARLRAQGQPVTAIALAWSSGPEIEARSDALNAEAREELKRLGAEPPTTPVLPPRPKR